MSVELNGIAHIQLSVRDPGRCLPFWEKLCHFLEMKTLIKSEDIVYCIGSRTGILVRGAPPENRDVAFDQNRAGLHHFCFRARGREDVDAIHAEAVRRGIEVVYPLTDESWGVRRFFLRDPNGIVINVMCHPASSGTA